MPAPRSILIDIHERGLNPQVAYKSVDSSGRIKPKTADGTHELVPESEAKTNPVTKEKPIKPTKKVAEDVTQTVASGEETVEVVSDEGAGSVEPKHEEEVAVETPVARPRGKRNTPSVT